MSYQPRLMHQPGHRLTELLDALKQEVENVANEQTVYRIHKDDFDLKSEMQQIRQTVYELEQSHKRMKERYEEEILRLKRELEARGSTQPQQQQIQPPPTQQHNPLMGSSNPEDSQQPPALGRSTSNVFGGIMSGQPPQPLGAANSPPPLSYSGHQPGQQPGQQHNQQVYNGYPPNPPGVGVLSPGSKKRQEQQQREGIHNGASNGSATPSSSAQPPQAGSAASGGPQLPPPVAQQPPQPQQQQGQPQQPQQQAQPQPQQPPAAQAQPQVPGQNLPPPPSAAGVPTVGAGVPIAGPQTSQQTALSLGNNLGDVDIDKIAPEFKKQKEDWFVVYNERAPRLLDVDIVQSLEHHSVVCCVRFSIDGKYIATGCNRSAQIFDVQTGALICRLQDESVEREGDLYIRSVCFSPDGKYLATGAEDKQIRVWDIKTRTIRYLFTGHEQDIYSLDFSRNGRHIASGSGDRTVRMWDMESGQCVLTLSIEDGVTTVAISPDGRYVAAGSLDKTVRVWDTSTGFLVERLEAPDGHKDSVYSVAFTPNGKDLVSGSLDKTIKLWELQAPRGIQSTHKGGVCVKTFVGHKDFVLSVASTPDSMWILSGSKDRGVQFWDPRTAQVQLMLQGHKNSVISVAPSPTGGLFATGSGDCRARIWRYYPVR